MRKRQSLVIWEHALEFVALKACWQFCMHCECFGAEERQLAECTNSTVRSINGDPVAAMNGLGGMSMVDTVTVPANKYGIFGACRGYKKGRILEACTWA